MCTANPKMKHAETKKNEHAFCGCVMRTPNGVRLGETRYTTRYGGRQVSRKKRKLGKTPENQPLRVQLEKQVQLLNGASERVATNQQGTMPKIKIHLTELGTIMYGPNETIVVVVHNSVKSMTIMKLL